MAKVIIGLAGGLGNQMFEYALGRKISITQNKELFLDVDPLYHYLGENSLIYYQLDLFMIDVKFATAKDKPRYEILRKNKTMSKIRYPLRWIAKKIDRNYIIQNPKHPLVYPGMFDFDDNVLKHRKGDVYIEGFWQGEGYFKDTSDTIRKDFTLRNPLSDEKNVDMIQKMHTSNSVSLHIRRNDYVGSGLDVATNEYYDKAIEYIKGIVQDPHFFVFSDDIPRCKDNIKTGPNTYFIDWNTKSDSYKDMILMSNCNHNIIVNSTFSWWGARLNNNPGKIVIGPKKWHQTIDFKGIIPSERIRL